MQNSIKGCIKCNKISLDATGCMNMMLKLPMKKLPTSNALLRSLKVAGAVGLLAGLSQGVALAAAPSPADASDAAAYDPKSKELSVAPILIHGVHGDVTVTTQENSSPVALKNGDKLKQGSVVRTGKKSTVDLIFSNGAVLALDAGTVLHIDQFLQAGGYDISTPVSDGKTVVDHTIPRIGQIDKEPTYSRTQLFLTEGSLYAQVKHLHKKSSYQIGNPLGVSTILGTTWKQVVTTDTDKKEKTNKIMLKEGLIKFKPIDADNQKHDPVFIHPQEEAKISGIFSSIEAMNHLVSLDSINVHVNVSVDINVTKEPIRDPDFPAQVAAFLPQDRPEQITSNDPSNPNSPNPTPTNNQNNATDVGPFATGDQGVGTLGTDNSGASGGGGNPGNTGSSTSPNNTPAS